MVMVRIAAVLVACVMAGGAWRAPLPAQKTFNVIGYYADWTAGRYPLADIPADKLTHVNYAFAKIGADNRLTWNASVALEQAYPGDCSDPGCPHGLFNQITVLKEKHPHLKFILSVGGWTDSGPFYEMAAAEPSRQAFVESCAAFLKTYPQFDGIDIDWEHPVVGGLQPGQPRDAHNYVLLLAALRSAIGPDKLLTVAVSASPRGDRAARVPGDGGVARLGQRHDLRLSHRRNARRLQFGALQPRRSVESAGSISMTPCRRSSPRACRAASSSRACRSTGAAGAASSRLTSGATGTGSLQVGGYRNIAETFLKTPGYARYWDDVAKVPWLYNADTKRVDQLRGSAVHAAQGRVHRCAGSRRRDVLGAVERRRAIARRVARRSRPSLVSFGCHPGYERQR